MIELRDVTMSYGQDAAEPVLHGIDLHVRRGELVLLCGRSGCGKSSVLRLVNGVANGFFDARITGDVLLGSRDITYAEAHDIAQTVGSVFQNPKSQFFTLDVISELAFGCENLGVEPAEIERRLADVIRGFDMEDLAGRQLMQLSGGEKQKVACAAVAAMDPEVLLLDEPSSNLDLAAVSELRQTVARWKEQGCTVMVAEHRLHYLADLVDRVVYLDGGRIDREITGDQFRSFSDAELHELGLRSIHPVPEPVSSSPGGTEEVLIDSLTFRYPKASGPALEIGSLALPEGQVIGVVGRNGAGKSTFVRSLTGLERRSRGTLHLSGSMLSTPRRRLRHSYLVMQDVNHQLFGESVETDVVIGTDHADEALDAHVTEVLSALNLQDKLDRHPMSLSGGERQRVAIASALVCGRELIVFDEPTSGLDLGHMKQVARRLRDLTDQGRTVLVVTHDVELLSECCDFLLQIDAGEVAVAEPSSPAVLHRAVQFLSGARTGNPAP
ncbi:MAG: ABC transporter ATP-binding protein [Brachybacterium sp.]|uniref:ABC transporter ATP-binding protein n=1 Tax=Brachybacterium sp. AOP35-5H-19 TaxID=3457685 RepID=UPI003FE366BC